MNHSLILFHLLAVASVQVPVNELSMYGGVKRTEIGLISEENLYASMCVFKYLYAGGQSKAIGNLVPQK